MEQENETYRYPWARNLFFVVLYVGLLIFLWRFPVESMRVFFRDLMGGFLYLVAGLILLGVTVLLVITLMPPVFDDSEVGIGFDEFEDEDILTVEGRVLGVPALRDPLKVGEAWDSLRAFQENTDVPTALVVDERAGVIMIFSAEGWGDPQLVHDLSRHLVDEGFKVKRVTV